MIKEFYMQRVRIPYKYEFTSSKAARRRFGSWNKAVIAAGFEPNPVKFAKKHEALDGHKCDSMAEKIIDDWLYDNKITHQREVRYFDSNFTADFKIGEVYIEYFGLKGQHYKYDDALKRKMALIKKNKLKLIAIYPRDIKNQARLNLALSKIGQ